MRHGLHIKKLQLVQNFYHFLFFFWLVAKRIRLLAPFRKGQLGTFSLMQGYKSVFLPALFWKVVWIWNVSLLFSTSEMMNYQVKTGEVEYNQLELDERKVETTL